MNITGVLVDSIVEISPEVYGKYVVYDKGRKFLYFEVLRYLYVILVASLLRYNKFHSYLE